MYVTLQMELMPRELKGGFQTTPPDQRNNIWHWLKVQKVSGNDFFVISEIMYIITSYCPYMKFKPSVWTALAQGEAEGQDRTDGGLKLHIRAINWLLYPHSWHRAKHDISILLTCNYVKEGSLFHPRHPGQ